MQLFGLKNCDSCRKALKALPQAHLIDVRAEGVPQDILEKALAQFAEVLVNTRSTTWRGLNETERAQAPLDLLKAHPSLMKRPLIVEGDDMYLGWNGEVQAALNVA